MSIENTVWQTLSDDMFQQNRAAFIALGRAESLFCGRIVRTDAEKLVVAAEIFDELSRALGCGRLGSEIGGEQP